MLGTVIAINASAIGKQFRKPKIYLISVQFPTLEDASLLASFPAAKTRPPA